MLREKDAVIRRAMIIFDGFIIMMSFLLAYYLRQHLHAFYRLDLFPFTKIIFEMKATFSDYLLLLFFIIPIWEGALYWNNMYSSIRTKTHLDIFRVILKSVFTAALVFGAIVFLFKLVFVSRLFLAIFIIVSTFFLLSEKMILFSIMHLVRKQGYNYRRLLIVGVNDRAASFIIKVKEHPEWGLRVEGVLDYEKDSVGESIADIKVKGTLDKLQSILHNRPIDEVVFIVPRSGLSEIENALYICETEGVKATIAVDLFELKIAKARQAELDGIPLITFETTPAQEWQLFIKRALDISISAAGLVILFPFFLMVALLIGISSPGPILYLQRRIGLNGRKFSMYKFRTMYKGAHQRIAEFKDLNMMKGPVFKIKNDPRITPIGKVLRKFSIDELPQLFNVLIGHMSLVGPRPPLYVEVLQYKPWQRRRLSMRPGLTCIWQISGRSNIGFDEWMNLDLEYMDNWSLWLDFKIIIRTIPIVLLGIGAH